MLYRYCRSWDETGDTQKKRLISSRLGDLSNSMFVPRCVRQVFFRLLFQKTTIFDSCSFCRWTCFVHFWKHGTHQGCHIRKDLMFLLFYRDRITSFSTSLNLLGTSGFRRTLRVRLCVHLAALWIMRETVFWMVSLGPPKFGTNSPYRVQPTGSTPTVFTPVKGFHAAGGSAGLCQQRPLPGPCEWRGGARRGRGASHRHRWRTAGRLERETGWTGVAWWKKEKHRWSPWDFLESFLV